MERTKRTMIAQIPPDKHRSINDQWTDTTEQEMDKNRANFRNVWETSPRATDLHNNRDNEQAYTESRVPSRERFARWEFTWIQRILERSWKVALWYVWEGVEIKMTTDKWTSEIDLSFGIQLAESQLCNLSENLSQFVTHFHSETALFGHCMILVWFLTGIRAVWSYFLHTYTVQ